MFQTVLMVAILAPNGVGEEERLVASGGGAGSLLGWFLVVRWVALAVHVNVPGDVWIFVGKKANQLSTEWADE